MEKEDDGGKKVETEVKRKEGMGKRWDRKRGVVRWQTKVESPKAAFIEQRETPLYKVDPPPTGAVSSARHLCKARQRNSLLGIL